MTTELNDIVLVAGTLAVNPTEMTFLVLDLTEGKHLNLIATMHNLRNWHTEIRGNADVSVTRTMPVAILGKSELSYLSRTKEYVYELQGSPRMCFTLPLAEWRKLEISVKSQYVTLICQGSSHVNNNTPLDTFVGACWLNGNASLEFLLNLTPFDYLAKLAQHPTMGV